MAAVVETASELFAERGPTATSIRDIAVASHVNHGLVHRHFGSKEGLVAAVLDHLNAELVAAADAGDRPAIELAANRYVRVIARAILDGYDVGALQHHFPMMSAMVDQARAHHPDEEAARLAASHVVALQIGWRLFEPFLRTAAGLQGTSADELDASISAAGALLRSGRAT